MSFLTAASERSSSGSGVSEASGVSFSGASYFSFSFCAALVLIAMHPPGHARSTPTNIPLPYGEGIERPKRAVLPGGRRPPRHHPDSESLAEPIKPRFNPPCSARPRLNSETSGNVPGCLRNALARRRFLATLERADRPPRGRAKALDQGLGAVQRGQPRLHILQPGVVGLARFLSERLLGVSQLVN